MKTLCYFAFLLLSFSAQSQSAINTLLDSAGYYYQQSEYAKALPLAKQAFDLAEQQGKDSTYINASILYANARAEFGEIAEAEAQINEAIQLRLKLYGKQHPLYAAALQELAIFYYFFVPEKEGLMDELYTEALGILKKNPGVESLEYAELANNLGEFYRAAGRYEEGYQLLSQALQTRLRLLGEQHPKYATTLNNFAALNFSMGRVEEAEPLFARAMELDKATFGADHIEYANGLNNLATLYTLLNRYEQAEALLQEALVITQKQLGAESYEYNTTLANLAGVYLYSERYEQAEKIYLQVLPFYKDKPIEYARELNNLSVVYQYQKRYELAAQYTQEALAIKAQSPGKESLSYAKTLNNLAFIYKDQRDYAAAEKTTLEALAILEKVVGPQQVDYLLMTNNLGSIYLYANDLDKSKGYLLKSIAHNASDNPLLSELNDTWFAALDTAQFLHPEQLLYALQQLHLLLSKQDAEQAHRLSLSILSLNERFRKGFRSDKDKLTFLKQTAKTAAQSLAVSHQLAQQTQQQHYIEEAFLFAEQNKSVVLADATRSQRARTMSDLPDSLALQELKLQEALEQYERKQLEIQRIAPAKRSAEQEAQLKSILTQINQLNFEATALRQTLEKQYPRYYQLKYKTELTKIQDIQSLLPQKTALLEYFVADSVVYIFVIKNNSTVLHALPIRQKTLAKKTADLRKTLSDYSFIEQEKAKSKSLFIETSTWFYNELLAPCLPQDADIERLIIIPDNSLAHLPFEVFLTEASKEDMPYSELPYLIKKYSISYNYSAGLLKEVKQRTAAKNNGQLLAYAPSYGEVVDSMTSTRRSPYTQSLRKILAPLPQAKEEVLQLSQHFKGIFRTDELANEARFKQEASDFAVLHLAMHGLLNKKTPMISSLAFSEDGDSSEDNFLEAWEIAHLKLNADLVVLSACETGYGTFEQGEGVLSLARAFLFAGVPSLVVSMWEVNDASTAQIMQTFYQELSRGSDKAKALQQAKIQYLSNSKGLAAHPAYWSPFIQLGDDSPIQLAAASRIGLGIWLLIGGSALFLVFFLLKLRRKA